MEETGKGHSVIKFVTVFLKQEIKRLDTLQAYHPTQKWCTAAP